MLMEKMVVRIVDPGCLVAFQQGVDLADLNTPP